MPHKISLPANRQSVRVQVYLLPDEHKHLQILAKRLFRNQSEVLRMLLRAAAGMEVGQDLLNVLPK